MLTLLLKCRVDWVGSATRMVAVGTLGLVACGGLPQIPSQTAVAEDAGCKSNDDCKGGRICTNSACVAPVSMTEEVKARIDGGDVAIELLRKAVESRDCYEFRGMSFALGELSNNADYRKKFMSELMEGEGSYTDPAAAFGEWLLLVDRRAQICKGGVSRGALLEISADSGALVEEPVVEQAVKSTDCAALAAVNELKLWPFETRFVGEVAKRDFSRAEVTRRLWLDTIETFTKECGKRLARRDVMEAETTADKLRRIVGLDDELLIGLRSSLMGAMERGDADAVRSYLASVTEREKALDARNAAALEAKMRVIQADYEKAKEAKAATAAASAGKKNSNAQPVAANGAKPAEQIRDAVETTKAAVEAVDVARSIFGF